MLSLVSYPRPSMRHILRIGPPPIPADCDYENSYLRDADEDGNDSINNGLLDHFPDKKVNNEFVIG